MTLDSESMTWWIAMSMLAMTADSGFILLVSTALGNSLSIKANENASQKFAVVPEICVDGKRY